MKKSKLAIMFIIAFTLTSITNITLCNAIEVKQQEGEKYLVFEPDGFSDDSLKVKIVSKCVFSSDSTIVVMKDVSRFDNFFCPL